MKKIYKNFILLTILFISSTGVWCQEGNFVFFNKTKSIYNSSFTGSEEGTVIVAGNQKRIENWNAQYLLFSSRIGENIGVGASIMREDIFLNKNISLFANFSYGINLDWYKQIYFGIRAGGNIYNQDTSNLRVYNEFGLNRTSDPLLQSYSNRFQPNIGIGVHYQTPNFFAGVSIPNLLISNEVTLSNGEITKVANQFEMNIFGGYFWDINETFTIKPYTQISYKSKKQIVFELASSLNFYQFFELGISYRIQESIAIFTLINIPQTNLQLGYGYQMYTTDLTRYVSGSHELALQYRF